MADAKTPRDPQPPRDEGPITNRSHQRTSKILRRSGYIRHPEHPSAWCKEEEK